MKRTEWELSAHNLRELLREFRERSPSTTSKIIKYKFGLLYNPMFDLFHLWNGISHNTMATFKLRDNLTIRYRPNSFYRHEVCKLEIPGFKTILLPSDNLSRHRPWVNSQIQGSVTREIERVRNENFLENESPMVEHYFQTTPFGGVILVRVRFSSYQQQIMESGSSHSMTSWLVRTGQIRENRTFSYSQLRRLYNATNDSSVETPMPETSDYRSIQEQYSPQQTRSTANNIPISTFYGRSMEQLNDALRQLGFPEGRRANESDLRNAAAYLDNHNVLGQASLNAQRGGDVWRRAMLTYSDPLYTEEVLEELDGDQRPS